MSVFERAKRLRERLIKETAERDLLRASLEAEVSAKNASDSRHEAACKARAILQNVAQETQKNLEYRVANIVTLALAAVFPDPYEFVTRFEIKRNKTECALLFKRDGEEMSPLDASGGGPCDVASFALRMSFWCLHRTRPVVILDEPFKFVSHDLRPKCAEMLRMITEKLGMQVIMVTHLPELIDCADKVFRVENGTVKEIAR